MVEWILQEGDAVGTRVVIAEDEAIIPPSTYADPVERGLRGRGGDGAAGDEAVEFARRLAAGLAVLDVEDARDGENDDRPRHRAGERLCGRLVKPRRSASSKSSNEEHDTSALAYLVKPFQKTTSWPPSSSPSSDHL